MLAEAFIRSVMYREMTQEQQDGESDPTLRFTVSWDGRHENVSGSDKNISQNYKEAPDRGEEVCHEPLCPRETIAVMSQAMCIPRRDQDNNLDLYTSWSGTFPSICRNYPDLHIGGDHILNTKKDSGCVLDLESDVQDGPVLLSVDIDSSSPPNESLGGPLAEGILHSEDSNILRSAPLSNSVLNGFIERKMQELYKQCYEDNLGTNGSPNPLLWSSILIHNVHQMSLQMSQEQNIEQARAQEAILQFLCGATSGGSSDFITPVLLISNLESRKLSGTASHNSALLKNCKK